MFPHDFIQYCDRFSLPRGVVTEEQVSSWFSRYVDCNESGCIVNSRRRNMMDYNLFKHFLEDGIESVVVSQEDKTAVTVDTVRRALVRYMHSLGCSVYKFYKVCTHGAEFLYEHHLRNILSTRCGIMLSNSAWVTSGNNSRVILGSSICPFTSLTSCFSISPSYP